MRPDPHPPLTDAQMASMWRQLTPLVSDPLSAQIDVLTLFSVMHCVWFALDRLPTQADLESPFDWGTMRMLAGGFAASTELQLDALVPGIGRLPTLIPDGPQAELDQMSETLAAIEKLLNNSE